MGRPIRVMLADDHRIIRQGLRAILLQNPDEFEVICEAEDGRSAVKKAIEHAPDVLLMDVTMPELNGIDATRKITAERPGVRVIALSMYRDWRYVGSMLRAGAVGYLCKDCASEELEIAVRTVAGGKSYFSPSVSDVIVQSFSDDFDTKSTGPAEVLTAREREILQAMAEGLTTKEIAWELEVSPKTVETHRRNIMEKLHVDSIALLTKYAIREGLTPLEV